MYANLLIQETLSLQHQHRHHRQQVQQQQRRQQQLLQSPILVHKLQHLNSHQLVEISRQLRRGQPDVGQNNQQQAGQNHNQQLVILLCNFTHTLQSINLKLWLTDSLKFWPFPICLLIMTVR